MSRAATLEGLSLSTSDQARVPASRPHVTVIIPAYNEEKSLAHVLRDIPRAWADEILVADNGSTDRTSEVAAAEGARVISQPERGYGAACLAGIAALPSDTQVVVFLDADYSDFPEDMEPLLAPILTGSADMTLSTRTRSHETRAALTQQQRWGNWLATTLIRWRFGFHYTDLGPFRAIRREALERLSMCDRNFGWTVEMQIKSGLAGLRVVEVPLRYRVRIGRSKISGTVKGTVLAGAKILYTIAKYSLRARSRSV